MEFRNQSGCIQRICPYLIREIQQAGNGLLYYFKMLDDTCKLINCQFDEVIKQYLKHYEYQVCHTVQVQVREEILAHIFSLQDQTRKKFEERVIGVAWEVFQ
jgi:hypothetical protein